MQGATPRHSLSAGRPCCIVRIMQLPPHRCDTTATAFRLRRWPVVVFACLALLLHGFAPLAPMAQAAGLPLGPDGTILVLCVSGDRDGGTDDSAPAGHHEGMVPCVLCSHWASATLLAPGTAGVAAPRLDNAIGSATVEPAPAPPDHRRAPFAARGPPTRT